LVLHIYRSATVLNENTGQDSAWMTIWGTYFKADYLAAYLSWFS